MLWSHLALFFWLGVGVLAQTNCSSAPNFTDGSLWTETEPNTITTAVRTDHCAGAADNSECEFSCPILVAENYPECGAEGNWAGGSGGKKKAKCTVVHQCPPGKWGSRDTDGGVTCKTCPKGYISFHSPYGTVPSSSLTHFFQKINYGTDAWNSGTGFLIPDGGVLDPLNLWAVTRAFERIT